MSLHLEGPGACASIHLWQETEGGFTLNPKKAEFQQIIAMNQPPKVLSWKGTGCFFFFKTGHISGWTSGRRNSFLRGSVPAEWLKFCRFRTLDISRPHSFTIIFKLPWTDPFLPKNVPTSFTRAWLKRLSSFCSYLLCHQNKAARCSFLPPELCKGILGKNLEFPALKDILCGWP